MHTALPIRCFIHVLILLWLDSAKAFCAMRVITESEEGGM